MYLIFQSETLIGRSELEGGDPPMGVASGIFHPTEAFTELRKSLKPARDGWDNEQNNIRFLAGLRATTDQGVSLVCINVEVFEYGEVGEPIGLEVFSNGIEYPQYQELFPHHVKLYYGDQSKD